MKILRCPRYNEEEYSRADARGLEMLKADKNITHIFLSTGNYPFGLGRDNRWYQAIDGEYTKYLDQKRTLEYIKKTFPTFKVRKIRNVRALEEG